MNEEQKFEDYRNRLNIRDVLTDAGYTLHKRDGLRYPAYVRLDNDGRRIRGDKFIVMPNKKLLFPTSNDKAVFCHILHLGTPESLS